MASVKALTLNNAYGTIYTQSEVPLFCVNGSVDNSHIVVTPVAEPDVGVYTGSIIKDVEEYDQETQYNSY